jgi:hypothetical protein
MHEDPIRDLPMKPAAGSSSICDIARYCAHGSWIMQQKVDGIRARWYRGKLWTNSSKGREIPNRAIQHLFADLNMDCDGELVRVTIDGTHVPLRDTVSQVMTHDAGSENIRYVIFDLHNRPLLSYEDRSNLLRRWINESAYPQIVGISNFPIHAQDVNIRLADITRLLSDFEQWGYEGAIFRNKDALYKYGRVGKTNPAILRYKFWEDFEGRIVNWHERMANDNEYELDLFGHKKRSSHQDNKTGTGTVGAFTIVYGDGCNDCRIAYPFTDIPIRMGYTYLGKMITAKRQKFGAKDKPRHPIFRFCIHRKAAWKNTRCHYEQTRSFA